MPGLLLVNAQDVARVLGPDPTKVTIQNVYDRIEELYLGRSGGGFNHDPSIRAIQDIFRGAITAEQAEAYCLNNGNPKGRRQNAEIVSVVGAHAAANISRCHRIGYVAVRISRYKGENIHVGIKAPFVRVRQLGEAYLVIPGFRKDSRPVGWQIEFVCSLAANQLARDDYEGVGVEYLYAGPSVTASYREFRAMYGGDMNLLSTGAIDALLQTYVEAVVKHLEKGHGVQPAHFAGYRIIDPAQGSLF
jgi:hypothetical protein